MDNTVSMVFTWTVVQSGLKGSCRLVEGLVTDGVKLYLESESVCLLAELDDFLIRVVENAVSALCVSVRLVKCSVA